MKKSSELFGFQFAISNALSKTHVAREKVFKMCPINPKIVYFLVERAFKCCKRLIKCEHHEQRVL